MTTALVVGGAWALLLCIGWGFLRGAARLGQTYDKHTADHDGSASDQARAVEGDYDWESYGDEDDDLAELIEAASAPSGPPPPPRGGRTTRELICCPDPDCASVDVRPLRRRAERGYAEWECRACHAEWQETDNTGRQSGWIA